jgi:hypothetical protein
MKGPKFFHLFLTATSCALALHVILILLTGGYSFERQGLAITGHGITVPIILLLALAILHFPVRDRTLSLEAFSHHEAAMLFSVLMIIYLANDRTIGSGDTLPARYLPLSILREGNFDLDEFPFLHDREKFPDPWFVTFVNGHYVSQYPVAAALLALPFYLPSALGHVNPQSPVIKELEKLSAASIVALSVVVLYFALRRLIGRTDSLLIAMLYALGTSSLSTSSQALWQHSPSQLALAAALYCLVRGQTEPRWVAIAGFPLGFAVISRPTDFLVALPLGMYVLFHHHRWLLPFVLSGLPPVCFQLWYNSVYFGNPFRVQFFSSVSQVPSGGGWAWSTPFGQGMAGILLSPGRGLFIYSPVLLLSVVGLGLAWKRNGDILLRYAGLGVLLTVLTYGKWISWWGGGSYGPRLLADLTPVLSLLLYPVSALLRTSRVLKVAFVILAIWSVVAHSIGAFADDLSWNGDVDVDHVPGRLWSWTDNQLVNPLREAFTPAIIAALRLPTSRTSPGLLSASYRIDSPPTLTSNGCKAVQISVNATNVGRAVWLAKSAHDKGVVRLGWRWRKGGSSHPTGEGRLPLRFALFPGESYEFRASITPPAEPGAYLLEVGLVSEPVTWFSERGSGPIEVTVNRTPTLPQQAEAFSGLWEQLRIVADDIPSLALSTDQSRYQTSGVLHLSLAGSVGERPWLVDVYLLLRGPAGALWFYDGHRLVRSDGCEWTPLAKAAPLKKGRGSGPVLDLALAGMPPGRYTWHLLLTKVEGYRIVADAVTDFEVR